MSLKDQYHGQVVFTSDNMEMQGMLVDQTVARKCGFGTFPVTIVPHFYVKLSDGIHLSLKFWFPASDLQNTNLNDSKSYPVFKSKPEKTSKSTQFPVILEYLPYFKTDWTSPRDFERHTWFCSHGYVTVRADMRGTGDSEGLYHDEYLPQEQQDCIEIIDWLAKQEWCNGRVGMYGKSWGGFNGLQVTYEQPEALKAVVSLYSTDNRYKTEMFRQGGCLVGNGLFSWASYMFILNARPPCPDNMSDWKEQWRQRLDNLTPWCNTWLRHQHWDDYLGQGSICQDYSRVTCPVLAIGGWYDGYHDAVFRLAENLPICRAIIGPWAHNWPDCALPGPNCAFLDECLQWFDCHLKCLGNTAMDVPLIRVYAMDTVAPGPVIHKCPGKWTTLDDWPSKTETKMICFIPNNENMQLSQEQDCDIDICIGNIGFDGFVGLNTGPWLRFGRKHEFPLDQTENNSQSLTWTTEELTESLSIMGFPQFECWVAPSGGKVANMITRLCDVRPDGTSTLITWGCVNLNRGKSHILEESKYLEPEKWMYVRVEFNSVGYTLPAGHRLCLSVSNSFWPFVWPAPYATTFHIRTGGSNDDVTKLKLPICTNIKHLTQINGLNLLMEPKPRVKLPITRIKEPVYEVNIERSDDKSKVCVVVEDCAGSTLLHDTNTILTEEAIERYEIEKHNPTSARVKIKRSYDTEWKSSDTKVHIEVECELKADEINFYTDHKLVVYINGNMFFQKNWQDTIKRVFI